MNLSSFARDIISLEERNKELEMENYELRQIVLEHNQMTRDSLDHNMKMISGLFQVGLIMAENGILKESA